MVHGSGFIKFYNCFMERGKNKLTPREWYFYSLLSIRWSPFTNLCETTISTISNVQNVFKDKSRPTRDKTKTWEQVKSLEDKGLIQLLDEDYASKKKFDFDKSIRIAFVDLGDGYEKIYPELYYLSDDPFELYFLCVIQRFKDKGFSHTYDALADLLSCGESTAQTTVNNLKNKKMITYKQGEKFRLESGQWSRKANTYYLYKELNEYVEGSKEKNELVVEEIKFDDKNNSSPEDVVKGNITIFGEITLNDLLKKKEYSNWGKKIIKDGREVGAAIVESDIDVLLTLEQLGIEEPFYKKYLGIINSWVKNKSINTNDIEKWMKSYHERMKIKRDSWEKQKFAESIVNAVTIGDDIIKLDKDNIGKIDFSTVNEIYFFDEEGKMRKGEYKYLAGTSNMNITEEMIKMATNEYKQLVIDGSKLTLDMIMKIRENVKMSSQK